MNITEVSYGDISKKIQYIDNNVKIESNTNSFEIIKKDEYQNSSDYSNGREVILDNEDGVVIKTEQKDNLLKKSLNNNDEIDLQKYSKIQIDTLYESGQITITQYELELRKRGLDESEDENETTSTVTDTIEEDTEVLTEEKDETEINNPFEDLMTSDYKFEDILKSAKQLINESNSY